MAYCSNCGAYTEPSANFCEKCGATISPNTMPTQPVPYQVQPPSQYSVPNTGYMTSEQHFALSETERARRQANNAFIWGMLSFLFAIGCWVSLYYLVKVYKNPYATIQNRHHALIGFIVGLVVFIGYFALYMAVNWSTI
jgi:hypothetical protein